MLTPDTLALHYRADAEALTVRWLPDASPNTLRAEYEAVLASGEARRSSRWLFDVRCRPVTTPAAAEWVTTDWLPRAAARLRPQRLRLAFLVTPARARELLLDPLLCALMAAATVAPQPYAMALFTDEDAALRWLLAHEPAGFARHSRAHARR